EIVIPWSLALLAADLLDDEGDREVELRRALPVNLGADDIEALLDLVAAARLPARTPLRLRLEFKGVAGRPGFALVGEWLGGGGRPLREPPEVLGGTVRNRGAAPRRMTYGQFQALAA